MISLQKSSFSTESQRFFKILKRLSPQFIYNPIFIFISLIIFVAGMTVLWVLWFASESSVDLANNTDVAFFVIGCVLCGLVFMGIIILFIYWIQQKRLNQQQRSFVSSVTHELRSPLASIQLGLETLQTRQLTEVQNNNLVMMLTQDVSRLTNLVDQILVSSRLDRGIRIYTEIETFYVLETTKTIISQLTHLDRQLMQRFEIDCPKSLKIYSAKPAFELAVKNLVENAIKYSPKGTAIYIDIEQDNNMMEFAIRDLGYGIDKREMKHIFKIFNRGLLSDKLAIPGTGLGLYIVKSVISALGGQIRVDSAGAGKGSTFSFKIPVTLE